MAYPTKYTRQYDFQSYQNANPTRPLPADKVNADLNLVQISTNEIVEFLKGIARDDGKIANAAVDFEQLTTQVRVMLGDETAVQTIIDMRDETVANAQATAADVGSTHADVASTNADVVLTHADVVTTGNDAATATAQADAAAVSATAAAASATVVSGLKFLFDTGTSMADPGAGNVRANNATIASATALAFSKNSADAGGPDVSDFLATWGASTNGTKRGSIVMRKIGAPSVFAVFDVGAAVTDNTDWLQITVGYVAGAGALSAADPVSVQWARAGDKGSGDLLSANNLSDLASASTARTNLGLGTIATKAATSSTALQKGDGSGGLAAATAGTDYLAPPSGSAIMKANAGAALANAAAGSDYVAPGTATAFTKQQSFTLATLTDGATINWDVSGAQKAKVTLGGNRTMAAVTNAIEGTTYLLWVIQDGTGSRTLSWTTTGAGSFDFGADGVPILTTTAAKADLLAFEALSIGGTLKLRYSGIRRAYT